MPKWMDNDMFYSPILLVCTTLLLIVGIDSIEGGVNGLLNKIYSQLTKLSTPFL